MPKSMFRIMIVFASIAATVCALPSAHADELDDLKARFKARYEQLQAAKDSEKIGETWQANVEAVNGTSLDADTAKLVAEENADRAKLYALIAKIQKTTPQLVAARNAKRAFENAKSGHWLKHKDGWKKKA